MHKELGDAGLAYCFFFLVETHLLSFLPSCVTLGQQPSLLHVTLLHNLATQNNIPFTAGFACLYGNDDNCCHAGFLPHLNGKTRFLTSPFFSRNTHLIFFQTTF